MTAYKYIDAAEVAKIVRQELKSHFPDIKFAVTTKKYSGGSSIRVSWTDGPIQAEVEAIAGQYCGATFDGMIDLKEHHTSQYNGETVHFGNDYIFFDRHHSDAAMIAAVEWYKSTWGKGKEVEFIPSKTVGKWTTSSHIATPDYRAEQEIYRYLRNV